MTNRLKRLTTEHRLFVMVVALFVLFRFLSVVFVAPGRTVPDATDALSYYFYVQPTGAGLYPFIDYWLEYPPIFPWLSVAAYQLGLLLPPVAGSNLFWFNTFLRWVFVLFEAANLLLLYGIGLKVYGREQAEWIVLGYALLFGPFIIFLRSFDTFVLTFILLALYGVVTRRAWLVGAGVGVGFAVKLFPLMVLPAAVRVMNKPRHWAIVGGIAAGLMLLIFLPFLLTAPAMIIDGFVGSTVGSVPFGTPLALVAGYTGPRLIAPLALRNDPGAAGWLPPGVDPGQIPPSWVFLAPFILLGGYLWLTQGGWDDMRRVFAFIGVTIAFFMLSSRGYSPQWGMYMAVMALLVMPNGRGIVWAAAWSILIVVEQPIVYWNLRGYPPAAIVMIVTRTMFIAMFALESVRVFLTDDWRFAEPVRRFALFLAVTFTVGLFAAISPAAADVFATISQGEAALGEFVERAPEDPTLYTEPVVHEQIHPFRPDYPLLMVPNGLGNPWVEPDEWLPGTLLTYDSVWFITGPDERHDDLHAEITAWLKAAGCSTEVETYEEFTATHYDLVGCE